MRSVLLCFWVLLFSLSISAQQPAIIPKPVQIVAGNGHFILKHEFTLYSNFPGEEWNELYNFFSHELRKRFGFTIVRAGSRNKADIVFEMKRMPTSGRPAYQLEVNEKQIIISSNFYAPAFHAMQTLFQLLAIKRTHDLPSVRIFDYPRFSHRGMHLDVARHFFPVSFIKRYIDYLAAYKFNTFHWHLTDDQGWRIEIKKYPQLTSIGSNRNGTIIGRYPGKGNDNIPYGGFYTQKEIKEVVQYAKERYIDIIPEIEMPGHASAAIAAYPSLSCFPQKPTLIPKNMISTKSREEQENGRIKLVQETWGVFDDVFCAGKDSTFLFLQGILDEVVQLFPYKYFHIGGDESPKTHWKICPNCQKRIKDYKLKDEHELQSWFVQKIEKYLNAKGKTIIGWDEILEGGLAPNAVVMSWRGEQGGIDAAKQGHDVIMSPGSPLYFDHSQSEHEDSVTIGGYNPLENVYAYDPVPKELTSEESKHILGAQANLWTEYIDNPGKVEYMIFPRVAALSEILWSPVQSKNVSDFNKRLISHFESWQKQKIYFRDVLMDLRASVIPDPANNGVIWKLQSNYTSENSNYPFISAQLKFIYPRDTVLFDTTARLDDKDVTKITGYIVTRIEKKAGDSGIYITPAYKSDSLIMIKVGWSTSASAWQRIHRLRGPEIKQDFYFNKATAKKITLNKPVSPKYPGDGAFTLVNGVQNEKGLERKNEFLGFEGTDCEVVIDLLNETKISKIVIHTFAQRESWIYQPKEILVWTSNDPDTFDQPPIILNDFEPEPGRYSTLMLDSKNSSGRYVKVLIKNFGTIPQGNPGAGHPAWLFVDEIEVH